MRSRLLQSRCFLGRGASARRRALLYSFVQSAICHKCTGCTPAICGTSEGLCMWAAALTLLPPHLTPAGQPPLSVTRQVLREFAALHHELTEVAGVKVNLFQHRWVGAAAGAELAVGLPACEVCRHPRDAPQASSQRARPPTPTPTATTPIHAHPPALPTRLPPIYPHPQPPAACSTAPPTPSSPTTGSPRTRRARRAAASSRTRWCCTR